MYRALRWFRDLQDNNHFYAAGDVYPRSGLKVSKSRISELAGNKNKLRTPLIVKISDDSEEDRNRNEK